MHGIAILGAGPYGLSLAAHLSATKTDTRIFGSPMRTWAAHMPAGMCLKSEGFASTLYDGSNRFPFSRFCQDNAIPYADVGQPVRVEDFTRYGLEFQKRFVPQLEQKQALRVGRRADGFDITFDDGECAAFRRVVLAVGIQHFARMPREAEGMPPELLTHSSAHHDMSRFAGRTVAIIGGGSSASDGAAALLAAGAEVHIVTRGSSLRFHEPPRPRTTYDSLRWPMTTIGTGWKSLFCTEAPLAFRRLPQRWRHEITRRHLGPVGCWFTREAVMAGAKIHLATTVTEITARGDRAILSLASEGQSHALKVDHIIAATGFKVDVDRLSFLDPLLRARIVTADRTPVLSNTFESTVPGLFFIGVAAANMFGPLLRFACGAEFAAGRLSRHLATRSTPAAAADDLMPLPVAPVSPVASDFR